MPEPNENICNDLERFKVECKDVGDLIRHYSTVRSALTTFLLTVGAASFSAYYHRQQTSPFFVVAGHLFVILSVIVCLIFSRRTEKALLYQFELWGWSREGGAYPQGLRAFNPPEATIWHRVWVKDWLNGLLVLVVLVLLSSFWIVTGAEAEQFVRALAVVIFLVCCLFAAGLFLIGSLTDNCKWASILALGLTALAGVAITVLLWK